MKSGRTVFWSISLAAILGVGGYIGWLQYTSNQVSHLPPPPGINPTEDLKRKMDLPPEPWSSPDPWWPKATIEAYDKGNVGKNWPAARRAVVAYGKRISEALDRTDDELDDAREATEIALQFDCDDPFVLFIAGRSRLDLPSREGQTAPESLVQAATIMKTDTRYPPLIRSFVIHYAIELILSKPMFATKVERSEAPKYLEAAEALYPEVAADRSTPMGAFILLLDGIYGSSERMKRDRKEMVEKLIAALEKEKWPTTVTQTLRGYCLTKYAWDARGSGWANTVTEAGWRAFADRLKAARAALTEAWEADNTNGYAPRQMITVCMGDGSDRAEMERWYDRAIKADPGNERACSAKLLYLEPKWGGSIPSMILFGRQLTQLEDPRSVRLPLLLARTHWDLSESSNGKPNPTYFADNQDVWDDISRVYEPYLKKIPTSRYHRTRYAVLAAWAGKWDVAAEQFQILGNDYARNVVSDPIIAAMRGRAKQAASTSKPSTE